MVEGSFEWHVARIAEAESRLRGISHKLKCERISLAKIKHGNALAGRPTPEYRIWSKMRRRCGNNADPAWGDYGGRGIVVCQEWKASFAAFLSDMGRRPTPAHTLDRRDNDGPYSPSNCAWATRKEQARNRRSSRILEFMGKRRTLVEWAERRGMNPQTLATRLADGWTVERALTEPVRRAR